MKKSGLLIIMLAIAVVGFSQEKKVRFGIHAGANISTIHSDFTYSSGGTTFTTKLPFKSIIGFTGGVHAEVYLVKNFYLQPELSYSQLGAKNVSSIRDSTSSSGRLELKGILHYVVLPVLVKYKFSNTGASVFVGPQVGYLIGTTNKINNTTINEKDNSNYKSDFSGIFGAEYYLPLGLGVSARYQLGLSNLQRPEYIDVNNLPPGVVPKSISTGNNAFTFTVGYRF
jgi:hypothetical protein